MQNGLYVALSAQVALQRRLETIANNVANMNTPGFRANGVSFEQELAKAGDNRLAYVSPGADFVSRRAGSLTGTGNPLDVAVQGDAFFAVAGGSGTVVYTRDGRMKISDTGELQNVNGSAILDTGGSPIQLNPAGGAISIGADGGISQGGKQTGTIGIFKLDEGAKLTRAGHSGFTSDKPGQPVAEFTRDNIVQGAIEGANVDPVLEMAKLITVTRTFDGVANEVTQTESSLTDAIKSLGSAA